MRVSYTWLVIFGLVITSLALFQFPDSYPHWSVLEYWLIAVVTALFFFASVVLHELAHSLLALRHGLPVKSITLFIFGGVSHIAREAERPRAEALIALAGPISSLLIAAAFLPLAFFGDSLNEQMGAMASWLVVINVILAIFNLLPGFPMDGGRVLRATLWAITGNYRKATRIATLVGRGFAYLLVAAGGALVFRGDLASGIWLIFIGLFVNAMAVANYRNMMRKEALRQYQVGDLMSPLLAPALPVEDVLAVEASENASNVMEEMEEKGLPQALVVQGGSVVGIIKRETF